MGTTLPVPIVFELPDGWVATPPADVGAAEAAYVALHPSADQGFTPNITISGGPRTDGAPLPHIADEALVRLHSVARSVELGQRTEFGTDVPGLTQAVRFTADINGVPTTVLQMQAFLFMTQRETELPVVLEVVLSSTVEQFARLVGEFRTFLTTVRPDDR